MVKPGGVYIGLGSNLGDREQHIRHALRELAEPGDIQVLACSTLHETDPVGGPPGQPKYLNAVAELATELGPRALLERLFEIEDRHGRRRTVPNGPRTLDLDLLLYRDRVIDEPDLCVPHPCMWQRSFVMQPLAEICSLERLVLCLASLDGWHGCVSRVQVAGIHGRHGRATHQPPQTQESS